MGRRIDLEGQRFGKLTVIRPSDSRKTKQVRWHCLCDCGKTTDVDSYSLRVAGTRSCGCLVHVSRPGVNARHGMWDSRTYTTWEGMKQRCLNPNATRYPSYGAVGITVCDRWLLFDNFYADMGERPPGKTLDRINPFGNYEPSNCRWATPMEQQHNQRRHYMTGRSEGL